MYVVTHVAWIQRDIGVDRLRLLFSPWIVTGGMILLTILSVVTMLQYLIQNRHIVRSLFNGVLARSTP